MIEIIEKVFLELMPIIAIFFALLSTYLIYFRDRHIEKFKGEIKEAVDEELELSKSAIIKNFEDIQKQTKDAIENINATLNSRLIELEKINSQLIEENRKKDGIINYKNKQIARMKMKREKQ